MGNENQAGKGDRYRPVDKKKYDDNYDRIFRRRKKTADLMEDLDKKVDDENLKILKKSLNMIKYTHCDADGYERGDMGRGISKTKRIYIFERIDTKTNLIYLKSYDIWGVLRNEVFPLHTIVELDEPIQR